MSNPFTATKTAEEYAAENAGQYLKLGRTRGKLLIVRPIKYQREGFVTVHKPEGSDVVFCDIALLDPVAEAQDEYGEILPAIAPGQFRGQSVLQGWLKGTFKRHVGQTLIGMIYFGPKDKGKPPLMWQDLSGDAACVARGQQFLQTNPDFLVPVDAAIVSTSPEPTPAGPPAYVPPAVLASGGYVQPTPAAAAVAGMSTLEQMKALGQLNHQGQTQPVDAPF